MQRKFAGHFQMVQAPRFCWSTIP